MDYMVFYPFGHYYYDSFETELVPTEKGVILEFNSCNVFRVDTLQNTFI